MSECTINQFPDTCMRGVLSTAEYILEKSRDFFFYSFWCRTKVENWNIMTKSTNNIEKLKDSFENLVPVEYLFIVEFDFKEECESSCDSYEVCFAFWKLLAANSVWIWKRASVRNFVSPQLIALDSCVSMHGVKYLVIVCVISASSLTTVPNTHVNWCDLKTLWYLYQNMNMTDIL